jgi:hypothetical protein
MTDPIAERRDAAVHEGGHVAAAWALGLSIVECTAQPEDGLLGRTRFETASDVASLIVRLAGFLAEGSAPVPWPPDWCDAHACDWEGLGELIRSASIPDVTYRAACGIPLDMAADPEWQKAVGIVAVALERVPQLDASDVLTLLA